MSRDLSGSTQTEILRSIADRIVMKDAATMLFSFGYWGWGTSTAHLVKLFDALERSRGFNPPILVDIRISRSVRAPGFNNRALERLVGADRYVHMPQLGNRAVREDTGEAVTIADPSAAESLIDLALKARTEDRRIVFFCACPYQMKNGEPFCHRYDVGSLLLERARDRHKQIVVTEWPGTEPQMLTVEITSDLIKKLRRSAKSIPVPTEMPLDWIATVTWGSVARCSAGGESLYARVDRAMWRPGGWYLPVLDILGENGQVASHREMRSWGFFERPE